MSKLASVQLTGNSGARYVFHLYPLGTNFKAVGGVYVITRRVEKSGGGFHHKCIRLGETADLSEGFDEHDRRGLVEQCLANCIWVHREPDQGRRREIRQDLQVKG